MQQLQPNTILQGGKNRIEFHTLIPAVHTTGGDFFCFFDYCIYLCRTKPIKNRIAMKKNLIILAALFCTMIANAQFTIWQPAITPEPQTYSVPSPSELYPERDYMMEELIRSKQIVSSETMTVNGFELYSETISPLKVKVIQRRSGQVEITCIGIKKNGYWKTCDKGVASLEDMYNKAKTDNDKSGILSLMDYGNYLLIVDPNKEIYVIE